MKSPIGQLVGGVEERQVKYAETPRPMRANRTIPQNITLLFMADLPLTIRCART